MTMRVPLPQGGAINGEAIFTGGSTAGFMFTY